MSKLDALFSGEAKGYRHPVLEFLSRAGPDAEVTVGVQRSKDILGYKPAKLYLHVRRNGCEDAPREYGWDDDLNVALVERGIRAASVEDEKERFALLLRSGFRKPEVRFGDGFFNAVLGMYVREGGFLDFPEVADVMRDVHTNRPHIEGGSYEACREMIEQALQHAAHALTGRLGYSKADAERILVGALALYLDERFTVADRRRLGWT